MTQSFFSTAKLSRSSRAFSQSAAVNQQAHFADLPLQARMLLAVPRIRGHQPIAPLAERYVLDALGRVIDPGPARRETIEAVNILAEVLLTELPDNMNFAKSDGQRLSSIENLVLCVLCKVRSGRAQEAKLLTRHWLNQSSIESFNTAAIALCNSDCIKRGGPHVFTPSSSGASTEPDARENMHGSVSCVQDLSVGESLLLNAMRLRLRTLRYPDIGVRVLPMLRQNLALPRIETLLDTHLVESLQYSMESPDIRCLCCSSISVDEANFLATFAAYSTGDIELIHSQLSTWLPCGSVERLMDRIFEFQPIVQSLGATVPLRQWNFSLLSDRRDRNKDCDHLNEPAMIH